MKSQTGPSRIGGQVEPALPLGDYDSKGQSTHPLAASGSGRAAFAAQEDWTSNRTATRFELSIAAVAGWRLPGTGVKLQDAQTLNESRQRRLPEWAVDSATHEQSQNPSRILSSALDDTRAQSRQNLETNGADIQDFQRDGIHRGTYRVRGPAGIQPSNSQHPRHTANEQKP
jgi:hypothetical protein